MPVPDDPKIYHIVHVDRLPDIVESKCLWSDAQVRRRNVSGTSIGAPKIKRLRLANTLSSHRGLRVGDCVPFYFCPRSVMLYVLHMGNDCSLRYFGGQGPIIHLEADLGHVVRWAKRKRRRWAFTNSNAATSCFMDWCDLAQLGKIAWSAVQAEQWTDCKKFKQAEFLIEKRFPWKLVSRIGVESKKLQKRARRAIADASHQPVVEVIRDWYY